MGSDLPAGDALVVDIREAYHLAANPVEGALHLPLGKLLAEPGRVPEGRLVIVVGHRTSDAEFASRFLRAHGRRATPYPGGAAVFRGKEADPSASRRVAPPPQALGAGPR